jgi:hypothetical protein
VRTIGDVAHNLNDWALKHNITAVPVREAIERLKALDQGLHKLAEPVQPNSQGMTSYELGWADCQKALRDVLSPVDGDDDGDDADADQDIK